MPSSIKFKNDSSAELPKSNTNIFKQMLEKWRAFKKRIRNFFTPSPYVPINPPYADAKNDSYLSSLFTWHTKPTNERVKETYNSRIEDIKRSVEEFLQEISKDEAILDALQDTSNQVTSTPTSTPRFAEEYIPQTMLKNYQQAYKEFNEFPKQPPVTGNNKVNKTELSFLLTYSIKLVNLDRALSTISFHLKVMKSRIETYGLSELPNKEKPFAFPKPVETAAKTQDTRITAPVPAPKLILPEQSLPTSRATPPIAVNVCVPS